MKNKEVDEMKIAVIVKTGLNDAKVYTTHRDKVTHHTDNLFLSNTDKNAIEFALDWIDKNGGIIEAYTFESGVLGDRVLHEALAMGANTATKFTGANINDPLQANSIAKKFAEYIKDKGYDLILTGSTVDSDVIGAAVADNLNFNYYDYVTKIDTKFKFETKLEKGNIWGEYKLPAVISVLDSINIPHLPSFINLRDAIDTPIHDVQLDIHSNDQSEIVADQSKPKQVIFDMYKDPDAVNKLVKVLKQDGILK